MRLDASSPAASLNLIHSRSRSSVPLEQSAGVRERAYDAAGAKRVWTMLLESGIAITSSIMYVCGARLVAPATFAPLYIFDAMRREEPSFNLSRNSYACLSARGTVGKAWSVGPFQAMASAIHRGGRRHVGLAVALQRRRSYGRAS